MTKVITINGTSVTTDVESLSYEDIEQWVGKPELTIEFRRAADPAEGSLLPGGSVRIQDGAVINAVNTNRA